MKLKEETLRKLRFQKCIKQSRQRPGQSSTVFFYSNYALFVKNKIRKNKELCFINFVCYELNRIKVEI